jgi:hypothetical protein
MFGMAYMFKPINHDTDEQCHTAMGESQDCDTTIELFQGNQKMK